MGSRSSKSPKSSKASKRHKSKQAPTAPKIIKAPEAQKTQSPRTNLLSQLVLQSLFSSCILQLCSPIVALKLCFATAFVCFCVLFVSSFKSSDSSIHLTMFKVSTNTKSPRSTTSSRKPARKLFACVSLKEQTCNGPEQSSNQPLGSLTEVVCFILSRSATQAVGKRDASIRRSITRVWTNAAATLPLEKDNIATQTQPRSTCLKNQGTIGSEE